MSIELLMQILSSDDPSSLIKANEEYVFKVIPELAICKGFNQNNPWHVYDVYEHILKVLENVPENLTARLAALFHDVGKPEVYHADEQGIGHFFGHWEKSKEIFDKFASKYQIDAPLSATVSKLIYYHDINFAKLTQDEFNDIVLKFTSDEIKLLFAIKRADLLAQNPRFHTLLNDYDVQEAQTLSLMSLSS